MVRAPPQLRSARFTLCLPDGSKPIPRHPFVSVLGAIVVGLGVLDGGSAPHLSHVSGLSDWDGGTCGIGGTEGL